MIALVRNFRFDEIGRRGVTAVEYALIAGVIAAVLVSSYGLLTNKLQVPFTTVTNTLGR